MSTKPPFSDTQSLKEARDILFASIPEGVTCPCCKQYAKLYTRKLNSGMARALIKLAIVQQRISPNLIERYNVFVDVSKIRLRGGDYAKLRWWKLIEQKILREDEKEEKRDSGKWRVTRRGFDFVEGKISVSREVMIYNNQNFGFSNDEIKIQNALSSKFNYSELMKPFHESIQDKIKENPITEVIKSRRGEAL